MSKIFHYFYWELLQVRVKRVVREWLVKICSFLFSWPSCVVSTFRVEHWVCVTSSLEGTKVNNGFREHIPPWTGMMMSEHFYADVPFNCWSLSDRLYHISQRWFFWWFDAQVLWFLNFGRSHSSSFHEISHHPQRPAWFLGGGDPKCNVQLGTIRVKYYSIWPAFLTDVLSRKPMCLPWCLCPPSPGCLNELKSETVK